MPAGPLVTEFPIRNVVISELSDVGVDKKSGVPSGSLATRPALQELEAWEYAFDCPSDPVRPFKGLPG